MKSCRACGHPMSVAIQARTLGNGATLTAYHYECVACGYETRCKRFTPPPAPGKGDEHRSVMASVMPVLEVPNPRKRFITDREKRENGRLDE